MKDRIESIRVIVFWRVLCLQNNRRHREDDRDGTN